MNRVDATKLRSTMKSKVRDGPHVHPAQVMATEMMAASDEVRAVLPDRETVRRTLRRQKRGAQPVEPSSSRDLTLPEQLKMTGGPNPEHFLIYDNGEAALKRMVVFASPEQLRHLALSEKYVKRHPCIMFIRRKKRLC